MGKKFTILVLFLILLLLPNSSIGQNYIQSPFTLKNIKSVNSNISLNSEPFIPTWNNITQQNSPSARSQQVMATDTVDNVSLLFGGFDGVGALGDTWLYFSYNNTWMEKFPSNSPSARYGSAMEYDYKTKTFILMGGKDDVPNILDEVWSYNVTTNTWSLMPNPIPVALYLPASAYDMSNNVIYLNGGDSLIGVSKALYKYNATSDTWTDTGKIGKGLYGHKMIWYSGAGGTGILVVFGGTDGSSIFGSGYTITLPNGNWNALGVGLPPARELYQMQVDNSEQKGILFGGYNASGYLNDIWQLDFSASSGNIVWTKINPTTSPFARASASLIYQPKQEIFTLFGGENGAPLHDTWNIRAFQSNYIPQITSPADISYAEGVTSYELNWTLSTSYIIYPNLPKPDNYIISKNDTIVNTGSWTSGDTILYDVGNLAYGVYKFEIMANNTWGIENYDVVNVKVIDNIRPTITHPPDVSYAENTPNIGVSWTLHDKHPDVTFIYKNNQIFEANGTWGDGTYIWVSVADSVGTYNWTIVAYDLSGNNATDTVIVTITPATYQPPPPNTTPASNSPIKSNSLKLPFPSLAMVFIPIIIISTSRKYKYSK